MRILNLIWGFSLGAGIDKCYLSYAGLGKVDKDVEMINVCIDIQNLNSHLEPLMEIGATLISIRRKTDFSWLKKLNLLIKEKHPDVVFTHGFNGAIMMMMERIVYGDRTRLVCTYHGVYHPPTFMKKFLSPIYNSLPIWIYRNYASKVICVEHVSKDSLIAKGVQEHKISIVYNGIKDINIRPLNLQSSQDKIPKILTASRLTEEKGLPYLLEALNILKNKSIAFHYYMIGEGPDLCALERKIDELSLNDYITVLGFQNNVPSWMAACDVFALPSLHECHSISILEAMRAGMAIVATNVGGNGESILDKESGLLVPAKDSVRIADALTSVLNDVALRRKLGENARKRFLTYFTEEAMQRNLINELKA